MSLMLHEMLLGSAPPVVNPLIYGLTWDSSSSRWIGVGPSGDSYHSYDGNNWYLVETGVTFPLLSVRHANGITVASGFTSAADQKTIVVSTDEGMTWRSVNPLGDNLGTRHENHHVAYGNGLWVIPYSSGTTKSFQYSSDLTNWTIISGATKTSTTLMEPHWNGTYWFFSYPGVVSPMLKSPDLVSFSTSFNVSPLTSSTRETDSMGPYVVTTGRNGECYVSANSGATFTRVTTPVATELSSVINNGSIFVVVGVGGVILTSPNGATWTPRVSNTTVNLEDVQWNGTYFLACGSFQLGTPTLVRSADGINWTKIY